MWSKRRAWGVAVPILLSAFSVGIVFFIDPREPVKWGVATGLGLALFQSFVSTAALAWAWNTRAVYWVWGGGLLFRLLFFCAVAFIVYRHTGLSLTATLVTMVSATTVFLVSESAAFFK